MGSESKISKESVAQAANELLELGKSPTVHHVREHLGGGSYSYISPYLKEWRESQKSTLRVVQVDLPPEVAEAHKQAVAMTWKAASELAGEKISRAEEQANESIKQAEADREELTNEISKLEQALAAQATELEQLKQSHEALRDENSSLKSEIAECSATVREQRERLSEALKWQKLADSLQNSVGELEAKAEKAIGKAQEAEQRNAVLTTQLEERSTRLAEAESQNAQQIESLNKCREDSAKLSALLEERTRTVKESEVSIAALRKSKEEAEQKAGELKGELKALRGK